MNKIIIFGVMITILIILLYVGYSSYEKDTAQKQKISELVKSKNLLFNISNLNTLDYDEGNNVITMYNAKYELNPEFEDVYKEIGVTYDPQNTVVIFPIFTSSAYTNNGFYSYYNEECGFECLTVSINDDVRAEASGAGAQILRLLGYDIISDIQVTSNPEILATYDKVIVLHNEYVTQDEFDAITNHPKVIYLYPNALYAKVTYDEKLGTITLIRGHGYPETSIVNGFDWKYDNTPMEYDSTCEKMQFYEINNGIMLNCYPEQVIMSKRGLLKTIKEF